MNRKISAATAFLMTAILLAIYAGLHAVPFTEIYLLGDRIGYSFALNIAVLIGILLFLLAKYQISSKAGKIALYVGAIFVAVVFPLLVVINMGTSFRGWEWAFESLLIACLPAAFLVMGFLVLFRLKFVSILLVLIFGLIGLFHVYVFVAALISVMADQAFSTANSTHVLIPFAVAAISLLCAFVNFRVVKPKGEVGAGNSCH